MGSLAKLFCFTVGWETSFILQLMLNTSEVIALLYIYIYTYTSLVAQTVKNLPACRRHRLDSWARKIPWRREWLPTPVV